MTAYERVRAWQLANPEKVRAQRQRAYDRRLEKSGRVRVGKGGNPPPSEPGTCQACGESFIRGRKAKWCLPCLRLNERLTESFRGLGFRAPEYWSMYRAQGGKCAICLRPASGVEATAGSRLNVDHCHKTGRIRGLLCFNCNVGIGHLRESADLFQKALDYLRTHEWSNQDPSPEVTTGN